MVRIHKLNVPELRTLDFVKSLIIKYSTVVSISLQSLPDPPPMLVLSSSIPQGEVARGSSVVLTCVATFSSQLDSVELTWGGPQTISTSDESKHKIVKANSGLTYGLQGTSDSSIAISVAGK